MINENFFLSIALLIVIIFVYKPILKFIRTFVSDGISKVKCLIQESKDVHDESLNKLEDIEKNIEIYTKNHKSSIKETRELMDQLVVQNERKIENEIKNKIESFENKKKLDKDLMIKWVINKTLDDSLSKVLSAIDKNKEQDFSYITDSIKNIKNNT
jgi:F0F1-type ATP synthase membrane subunit b/b'